MVTSMDVLRNWCNEGWKFRGFNRLPKDASRAYRARISYELDLIESKGYVDYFLVVSDAVRWAKNNLIPVGPARGSAAASLVCYTTRITEIDPMKFPLMLFERFIDPNRFDLPDIDLDFDDERRALIVGYLEYKYGQDRIGKVGSYTRYRGKNSLDDVGRVYNVPFGVIKTVKEMIITRDEGDERFTHTIEDTVELFPRVKEIFDKYPDLYKAAKLEGNYKTFGIHAAGVVIGADSLDNYVAAYEKDVGTGRNKVKTRVISADKYDGEALNLMKMDFLGLTTMGMIRHAIDLAGITLEELYAVPLDDPKTLAGFRTNDVTGIFQFDGHTMRSVNSQLKPQTIMDLAAVNALARPGALNAGSTGKYIQIRNGTIEKESLHPLLDAITSETEGQIIYQEQVLKACRDIAGFSWELTGKVRKMIGRKSGAAAFEQMREMFVEGAAKQEVSESVASAIWDSIVASGSYAFNISHSVSYSMLGYWVMYLKQHHPLEFYTASLRKASKPKKGEPDPSLLLMRDAVWHGIRILPPVYRGPNVHATWEVAADDAIRAGLEQIPGVGEATASDIVAVGALDGVKGVGPKTKEKIIEFCMLEDPFGIGRLEREEKAIRDWIRAGDIPVAWPDTLSVEIPSAPEVSYHVVAGRLLGRTVQNMFEGHRARTGEILDPNTVTDPELQDAIRLDLEDRAGTFSIKVGRYKYEEYKDVLFKAHLGYDWVIARVKKLPFFGQSCHVQQLWVINPD